MTSKLSLFLLGAHCQREHLQKQMGVYQSTSRLALALLNRGNGRFGPNGCMNASPICHKIQALSQARIRRWCFMRFRITCCWIFSITGRWQSPTIWCGLGGGGGEFEKALAAKLLHPIVQASKVFFKLVIKTDNQVLINSMQEMLESRLEQPFAEVLKHAVDLEDMDMETKLQTLESFKEEGREEGRQEGREEGQRTALDQMARLKFGASVFDELMEVKNSEQLGQVSGWIFECETAEELEGRIKSLCTA